MDKLQCMKAFVAVVAAKGFTRAARNSRFSKALLSKYVAKLEDELGTRLLQRSTRHVSTTEVGRAYYERCLALLEAFDELESLVQERHVAPTGELRITAPTSFAELHLMNVVAEFGKQYPQIIIKLNLTDREVDIIADGIDIAIRIGKLSDSSLIARPLGNINALLCASPAYLKEHGNPTKPNELLGHRCVIDTNFNNAPHWYFKQNQQTSHVTVDGACYVNSAVATRQLILNNVGIAVIPDFVVHDDIEQGRLVSLLTDYEITTFGLYAVYSHRRHLSSKVKLFLDALKDRFNFVR